MRLIFFKPNRGQSIKNQDKLRKLYKGLNVKYYAEEDT